MSETQLNPEEQRQARQDIDAAFGMVGVAGAERPEALALGNENENFQVDPLPSLSQDTFPVKQPDLTPAVPEVDGSDPTVVSLLARRMHKNLAEYRRDAA